VAALLRVLQIIEAEAEDLSGSRHRQAEAKLGERPARRGGRPPREIRERREIAVVRAEPFAEIGGNARIHRLQVDDRIAVDDAESEAMVRFEADDAHGSHASAFIHAGR
jgi:hypothetical protein